MSGALVPLGARAVSRVPAVLATLRARLTGPSGMKVLQASKSLGIDLVKWTGLTWGATEIIDLVESAFGEDPKQSETARKVLQDALANGQIVEGDYASALANVKTLLDLAARVELNEAEDMLEGELRRSLAQMVLKILRKNLACNDAQAIETLVAIHVGYPYAGNLYAVARERSMGG